MSEPRDLFGRTEAELVAAIALGERTYDVSKGYTGGEGLAINLARHKANLEVDRRELKKLRGERVEYPETPRYLTEDQLAKWRKEFMSFRRRS